VRLAGDGEVLVRGPLVMRGYYRDLARTAAALDRDGWLHTGEVGTLDSGGFLTIVDRKEEPITTAPRPSGAPAPPTRTA
jgi:long-subunit acyl-CoA synthetase (AMP-forming)